MSLRFESVSKNFGEHKVLTEVSFSAQPGEVIALMGENGAGKTTLMRILAGVYPQGDYSGEISLDGKPLHFQRVSQAQAAGIAMVHQELGLFSELTVAENLFLKDLTPRIRWKKIFQDAQIFLDSLKFEVSAKAKVKDLSTGTRQLVEIARALHSNAQVYIFDEPTSALTEKEASLLFGIIEKLSSEKKIVFYVSHRMKEIFKITKRTIILRDGKIAGDEPTSSLDEERIIKLMVGRDVDNIYPERPTTTRMANTQPLIKTEAFELYPGEIVGVGGLMGAGRSELALAVYGNPRRSLKKKMAFLTEDRKLTGLCLNRPAAENMTLSLLSEICQKKRLGHIPKKIEHETIRSLSQKLKIRGPGLHAEVGVYSGGNQQKVALAKCLAINPKVLILDEPTRGIDIGAKLEIYELIAELSRNGVGILLISSEMPELLGLSDRVIVLKNQKVVAEFKREEFDPEKILTAAS